MHLETQCEISGPYLSSEHASRQYREREIHRFLCVDDREKSPPSARMMQSYFQDNGLCPVLARGLLCQQSLSHVYLAAAAIRHSENFAAHDPCSDKKGCVASNNLDLFEPYHAKHHCPCLPVKPDIEQIHAIVQRNEVPIARLAHDRTNRTILDIAAASSDWKYTAVSHFWADGLASAKYKGDFQCQLDKLFQCVWMMQIEYKTPGSNGEHRVSRTHHPFVRMRQSLLHQWLLRATSSKRVAVWLEAVYVPVIDVGDPENANAQFDDTNLRRCVPCSSTGSPYGASFHDKGGQSETLGISK